MRYVRTGFALSLIVGLLAFIRWQMDEKTTLIAGGMVVATFLVFSIFMDDSHSVWLAKTRNVPAWGQVVAGFAVLVLVGPMVWQAGKSAVEAVVGSFEATRCLMSGGALIALICLVLLNRFVRRRRVRVRTTQAPTDTNTAT